MCIGLVNVVEHYRLSESFLPLPGTGFVLSVRVVVVAEHLKVLKCRTADICRCQKKPFSQ